MAIVVANLAIDDAIEHSLGNLERSMGYYEHLLGNSILLTNQIVRGEDTKMHLQDKIVKELGRTDLQNGNLYEEHD